MARRSIPSRSSGVAALWIGLSTIALLVLSLASVADAKPGKPDKKKARAHFEQAEAFFETGVYDEAIKEYKLAYEFAPTAHGFLFNIGLAYEKSGDDGEALSYYGDYIEKAPNGKKTSEAKARKVAIERRLEADREEREAAEQAKAEERAKRAAEEAKKNGDGGKKIEEPEVRKRPPDKKLANPSEKGLNGLGIKDKHRDDPPPPSSGRSVAKWAMLAVGAGLLVSGVVLDLAPENSSNGSFDGSDLVPPALYSVGATLMLVGYF